MRMKTQFFRLVVIVGLIFTGAFLALAQDTTDSPLLALLARVPDLPGNRGQIIYADRAAVEVAYPGTRVPEDWAEFIAMNDAEGSDPDLLPVEVWWRIFVNQLVPSGQYVRSGENMAAVMGFDYFDIDRELLYGTPPAQGLILEGVFDEEAVRTALEARGFTQDDTPAGELWCGSVGCDEGNRIDTSTIDRANPFGGDLGRQQPVAVLDDMLMSSPNLEQVEGFLQASAEDTKILADDVAYQAAGGAVSDLGVVLQAAILDGELLISSDIPFLPTLQGRTNFPIEEFVTIPQYRLMMIADVVSEDQQIGAAAFVFSDLEDAVTAVSEMARRLQTLYHQRTRQSYADDLEQRRATIETQVVERDGLAVGLVLLTTPKATAEQIVLFAPGTSLEDLPPVTAPGLLYRFLFDGIEARENLWYSTVPREIMEELVEQ